MKLKLITLILTCLYVEIIIFPGHVFASQPIESYDFKGITISDSEGNVRSEFTPSKTVYFEADISFEKPGLVILHGTVSGNNWSENLSLKIHAGLKGSYKPSWHVTIPVNADGLVRVDITLLSPLHERLIRTAFFSIITYDAVNVGSEACKLCHPEKYETWKETLHAPLNGCESCHGPGSEHSISNSIDYIIVDTSPELCGKCHIRNNGTSVETKNGFIRNQQEFNMWKKSSHANNTVCNTCHNTHFSLATARKDAIKIECIDCHYDKTVSLNMQQLMCEDCHMPYAVFKTKSDGFGVYREADLRAHIWRIKGEVEPEDMFNFSGTALAEDSKGLFLTLNFSCLTCHDGKDAFIRDFDYVQHTFTLVH